MNPSKIKLIISSPASTLEGLFSGTKKELIILSPWIKTAGVKLIIKNISSNDIDFHLYTRINFIDLAKGISDLEAIRILYKHFPNLLIRCIPNLHAKIYISDRESAFLTSSNLTLGGMVGNVEAGILLNDKELVNDLVDDLVSILKDALPVDKSKFEDLIKEINYKNILELVNEKKVTKREKDQISLSSVSLGKRITASDKYNTTLIKNINKDFQISLIHESNDQKETWVKGSYGKMVIKHLASINPEFKTIEPELVEEALFHTTYINSNLRSTNISGFNRLSTLGAHVLDAISYLEAFRRFSSFKPQLLKFIKSLYSVQLLDNGKLITKLNIDKYLLVAPPNIKKSPEFNKIVYHAKLAFIGVLYLSFGYEKLKKLIFRDENIEINQHEIMKLYVKSDYKTVLMELCQQHFHATPAYKVIKKWGSDHKRNFEVIAVLDKTELMKGKGASIAFASLDAAKNSLSHPLIKPRLTQWIGNKYVKMKKKPLEKRKLDSQRKFSLQKLMSKLDLNPSYLELCDKSLLHPQWCNDNGLDAEYSYTDLVSPGNVVWVLYIHHKLFLAFIIKDTEIATATSELHTYGAMGFDKLKLRQYLFLSRAVSGQPISNTLKTDIFQSVLYVKYISSGFDVSFKFLDDLFRKEFSNVIGEDKLVRLSSKANLQDIFQKEKSATPTYSVLSVSGPEHKSTWKVGVYVNDTLLGIGRGESQTKAGNDAAFSALSKIISDKEKVFSNIFK